jgi:prolyl 4-hydroxylase
MPERIATAELQRAHALLQANQMRAGIELLTVLANQNYAPALHDLALVLLIESPTETSLAQARLYLQNAEAQNYAPAIYQLASFDVLSATDTTNWQAIAQRLERACHLHMADALCDAAVLLGRLGNQAQQQASTQLLELAALRGSDSAMALLGERLASGLFCTADPARANSIRQLARQIGLPVPAPDANFGFSSPEPRDEPQIPPDLQLAQLPMQPPIQAAHWQHERVGLKQFTDVFSAEECLYIQCAGARQLAPSISVDPNGQTQQNRIRTSHDFLFGVESETLLLKCLQQRMAAYAGLPLSHAEALVLLRYGPGQEYRPHRDYLPPSHFTAASLGGSGQRLRTVIAYLNSPESGGATAFPLLETEIKAQQGHVLCFNNIRPDGQLEAASLHAGLPVIQGVKWICTLWMREHRHRQV